MLWSKSDLLRNKPRDLDGEKIDIRLAEFPVDRLVEGEHELREGGELKEAELRRENEVCVSFAQHFNGLNRTCERKTEN